MIDGIVRAVKPKRTPSRTLLKLHEVRKKARPDPAGGIVSRPSSTFCRDGNVSLLTMLKYLVVP